jgi:hypothetical protein
MRPRHTSAPSSSAPKRTIAAPCSVTYRQPRDLCNVLWRKRAFEIVVRSWAESSLWTPRSSEAGGVQAQSSAAPARSNRALSAARIGLSAQLESGSRRRAILTTSAMPPSVAVPNSSTRHATLQKPGLAFLSEGWKCFSVRRVICPPCCCWMTTSYRSCRTSWRWDQV